MRDFLVIGQMAVTTVLLIVAGLLMRSLSASKYANVGFASQGVATVSADTGMLRYSDERSRQFFDEALRRVRALPGVQAAAIASRLPFSLNFSSDERCGARHQTAADQMGPPVQSAQVSPDYFETLRIPLLQGRVFTAADTPDTPIVVVINQTMARRFWPDGNAIGQRVHERTLAGTALRDRRRRRRSQAADGRRRSAGRAVSRRDAAALRVLNIVARRQGDEQALVAEMRQVMLAIEPNLLLFETHTMRDHMSVMLLPTTAGAAGDGLLRARADARGGWPLRCDRVFRLAAHAGNRHPHGARRARSRCCRLYCVRA